MGAMHIDGYCACVYNKLIWDAAERKIQVAAYRPERILEVWLIF